MYYFRRRRPFFVDEPVLLHPHRHPRRVDIAFAWTKAVFDRSTSIDLLAVFEVVWRSLDYRNRLWSIVAVDESCLDYCLERKRNFHNEPVAIGNSWLIVFVDNCRFDRLLHGNCFLRADVRICQKLSTAKCFVPEKPE